MLVKLISDKKTTEFTKLDVGEDVQEKAVADGHSVAPPNLVNKDKENEAETGEKLIVTEKDKVAIFRQQVLIWIFLESCLEMVVVSSLTLLTIKWIPLRRLIEENFWPLEIFIIFLLLVTNSMYRIPALSRAPGCCVPKLFYWLQLISLHILLAIHFPILLQIPSLSPHFSVLAASAMAASYTLISVLAIKGKVSVENRSLFWCGMVVPAYSLLSIQPAYFLYRDGYYQWLMINMCSAMFVAVLFSFENIYFTRRLVKSKKLEEIAIGREGVISLIESGYIATVVHRQPSYYKKETKSTENEKV